MVDFHFQYFCLGLHSHGQKKLLEKIRDIFLFLKFYSRFFHLFRQWRDTSQNFVLYIIFFKGNNLPSIAKASPEFTADFESISTASYSLSLDLERLLSGSTFWLVTDWIHLAHNSFPHQQMMCSPLAQSSSSRNYFAFTSELSSCKISQIHDQPFRKPQH